MTVCESARKGGKTDAGRPRERKACTTQEVEAWAIKNCCNWAFSPTKCAKCCEAGTCSVPAEREREAAQ